MKWWKNIRILRQTMKEKNYCMLFEELNNIFLGMTEGMNGNSCYWDKTWKTAMCSQLSEERLQLLVARGTRGQNLLIFLLIVLCSAQRAQQRLGAPLCHCACTVSISSCLKIPTQIGQMEKHWGEIKGQRTEVMGPETQRGFVQTNYDLRYRNLENCAIEDEYITWIWCEKIYDFSA